MKKLMLFSLVVAFALVGAQAFASPPVPPPVEGFVIQSTTYIDCKPDSTGKNSVNETESFSWIYFDGWGTGPFYPNGYTPVVPTVGSTCPYGTAAYTQELGFSAGAQIEYEQEFEATNGDTIFDKSFTAKSDIESGEDNLVVEKTIKYGLTGVATGTATHLERVGLSVISMGANSKAATPASGLLSLCPWAAETNGSSSGGYPATNEGIAGGSEFDVKKIDFKSKSNVNSTINPMLAYDVNATGEGTIGAGFVVELWEAPKGWVDDPYKVNSNCCALTINTCDPRYNTAWGTDAYILPKYVTKPPIASRTSYSEAADAQGLWTFKKSMLYESVMPGAAGSSTFPFNQVP